GSNWTTQTVDTDTNLPDSEPNFSLALDSNDTPYILYYTKDPITFKLAVLQNSSWTIEPVVTSLHLVTFGNMVLDSAGHPHFLGKQYLYPEGSDNRVETVEYVHWDGFVWKTQTVTSNVSLTQLGLLALDSEDRPHIIYISWFPQQLMYARWIGTEWETYHVDRYALSVSHGFSFALDAMDNPHISYITAPGNSSYWVRQLKYTTATLPQLPPPLDISIISPENITYVTNEIPLAFKATKQPASIYYSLDREANVTITGNTTLTNLPNGTHNLTIYAEDSNQNNPASEIIYFTVKKEDSTILLVSTAIITILAITVVYVWKKKH
ncbi:MAG: hypothetical protein NWF03_04470, partial [Candidatus Bathyarchaeota archaeon]|nr:hypothetical protein [Candidatus Bathyarchaeota archaeon]